jgi:hypothetical protein
MFNIHHIVIVGLHKSFKKLVQSPYENSRQELIRNNAAPTLQADILS